MKYFKVYTIADGYHDGPVVEVSNTEFKELFVAYTSLYELLPEYNVFSDGVAWFQFQIFEEDGVALFVTDDSYNNIPAPTV